MEFTIQSGRLRSFQLRREACVQLVPGADSVDERLQGHLSGAKERFGELDEDDREAFRAQLKRFVSMYAFLSQVIDYTDTDMERRYLYGRHLAKVLPRSQDGSFDLPAGLRLAALRTEQVGEARDVSLDTGGGPSPPSLARAPDLPTSPPWLPSPRSSTRSTNASAPTSTRPTG